MEFLEDKTEFGKGGLINNSPPLQQELEQPSANINDSCFLSNILFLIVLYKTELDNSLAFQTLRRAIHSHSTDEQVDILVCDNSPVRYHDNNSQISYECFNLYFLYDSTNPGISLSYNRGAEIASIKGKKWMLVLDQDSKLPVDFLYKYIDALKVWPEYPIYAPKLYSNNLLLSPCKYIMNKGIHFESIKPGIYTLKQKNVLNSGLLISIAAYQNVGGYDENVWLYFSDFVFFNRLKKKYKKFIVLDCCIEHPLSSSDYTNSEFALKRFTYYCQGAKEASKSQGGLKTYLDYVITVGLRSILMTYRFRNIDFLKIFANTFFLRKNEN